MWPLALRRRIYAVVAVALAACVVFLASVSSMPAENAFNEYSDKVKLTLPFFDDAGPQHTGVSRPFPPVAQPACPLAEDQAKFVELAHVCTDKTTTHHYEGLYARVFYRYRHLDYAFARSEKKYSLLEMGIGCNMICFAGGYRLIDKFIPQVAYHGMDPYIASCSLGFRRSEMRSLGGAYLLSHSCRGSNQDLDALQKCSNRFGPFEIIVDDASHFQSHVTNSYELVFNSPMLNPGGYYVVEDLDSAFSSTPKFEGLQQHQKANKTFPLYVRNMIACWVMDDCDGYPAVTRRNRHIIDTIGVFHESVYLRKAFDEQHQLPQWYISETPGCLHDVMYGLAEGPDRHPGLRIRHSVSILDFFGACQDPKSSVHALCVTKILPLFPKYRISSWEELSIAATGGEYDRNKGDTETVDTIMRQAIIRDGSYVLLSFSGAGSVEQQERVVTHIVSLLQSPHLLDGCVIAVVGLKQVGRGGPVLTFLYDIMLMMLSYRISLRKSENTQNVVPPHYKAVLDIVTLVGEVTFVSSGDIAYITKMPLRSH